MKLSKKFFTGLYIFLAGITMLITIHYKLKHVTTNNGGQNSIGIITQTWIISFWNQTNIGFSNFDTELLNFIWTTKWDESFMISPISFKAALAMLTIWANWDTEKELLDAIWYKTSEDFLNRAINLKELTKESNEKLDEYNERQKKYGEWYAWWDSTKKSSETNWNKENSFMIANSVRHNSDQEWKFTDQYKEKISKIWWTFWEVPGNQLDTQINSWVNKYTNWLIPSLIPQPIPNVNTVLVNTTYLKSAWTNPFEEYTTKPWKFTTIEWDTVQKDFMHKSDKYLYYEDKNSQVLTIKLQWWFAASFVLWNSSDILQKIENSSSENVKVTLPKFELETSFDKKELITFLANKWLWNIFNPGIWWDFSNMVEDVSLYIDDIIQKTKIKLNEDWLEAAAATAIMMKESVAIIEKPKYKEFTANRPFQFYIYTDDNEILEPQLLFYGQIIK